MVEQKVTYNECLLVQSMKQGDERAFTEMVDKYKKKAFAIAYRFTNNVEDAKDLSQEAFVKVYRCIGSFRGESSFLTWFYRILTNLCIDFKRRRSIIIPFSQFRKKAEGNESNTEERMLEDKGGIAPGKALLAKELNEKLTQAIEFLSAKQKIVFVLRNFEGLALKEIAKIMNCAEGSVKSHLARAVKKLQDIIGPYALSS